MSHGLSDHENVIREFSHGDSGSASNLASVPLTDGDTALVGYGWAIYAVYLSGGTVVRYNGWKGFSNTTSRHLNLLDGWVDVESDAQPTTGRFLSADGLPDE